MASHFDGSRSQKYLLRLHRTETFFRALAFGSPPRKGNVSEYLCLCFSGLGRLSNPGKFRPFPFTSGLLVQSRPKSLRLQEAQDHMTGVQYDQASRLPTPRGIYQLALFGSISPKPFTRRALRGRNGNNPISINEVVLPNRYKQNSPPPLNEIAGNGLGR